MTLRVVTEGSMEARLITRILKPILGDAVRVFSADCGPADPASLARTFLGDGWPVALVLHTKTLRSEKIRRLRGFYERMLTPIDSSDAWRVVFIKPRLELLLFHDPEVLRLLVGRVPTQEEMERARTRPRKVLAEMLGIPRESLASELERRLEGVDLSRLATHPQLQKILDFHAQLEAEAISP